MKKEIASEHIKVTPTTKGRIEVIGSCVQGMKATYESAIVEVLDYWDEGHLKANEKGS